MQNQINDGLLDVVSLPPECSPISKIDELRAPCCARRKLDVSIKFRRNGIIQIRFTPRDQTIEASKVSQDREMGTLTSHKSKRLLNPLYRRRLTPPFSSLLP